MKLLKNRIERRVQSPGIDGMYEMIRNSAAICYQTDVNTMKLSPKDFVNKVLIANGHGRPLEFGTVYLKLPPQVLTECARMVDYTKLNWAKEHDTEFYYVTTNFRVIMQGDYDEDEIAFENGYDKNYLDIMEKYWCEPTKHHFKRYCYSMIASRGVTDDLRTHITLSSICESTRFCNYSKERFGGGLSFIQPYWIDDATVEAWYKNLQHVPILDKYAAEEQIYFELAALDYQPQQLKRVFPLGVKAELLLCGFKDAWENLFWRRSDSHADPEATIISKAIEADIITINDWHNDGVL